MLKENSSATDIELRWCVGTRTIALTENATALCR